MDRVKTMDLTRIYIFIQINNTVVLLRLFIKKIHSKLPCKHKVHQVNGATPCFLYHGFALWTFMLFRF